MSSLLKLNPRTSADWRKSSGFFMTKIPYEKISGNFKGKDIISLDQFTPKDIEILFSFVPKMRQIAVNAKPSKILAGKIVVLLFYEPSSRTFGSFSTAIKQLGGQTVEIQNPQQFSSVAKGETFEDTIKVFEAYSDGIIIRHPAVGSATEAAKAAKFVPIVNAGDGPGEHPTQTLLDMYTIFQTFNRLSNLKIAFVGDPLHYRTFHGQVLGLSKYPNNQFYGISPKELKMPNEFRNPNYHDVVIDMDDLDETLASLKPDIISVGRIPKEYISEDAKKYSFQITKKTLKSLPSKSIIMHPLPRVGEISTEVDEDLRAVYLRSQVRNGQYVRMALLALVLGGKI